LAKASSLAMRYQPANTSKTAAAFRATAENMAPLALNQQLAYG